MTDWNRKTQKIAGQEIAEILTELFESSLAPNSITTLFFGVVRLTFVKQSSNVTKTTVTFALKISRDEQKELSYAG